MPIEIFELVIRAKVDEDNSSIKTQQSESSSMESTITQEIASVEKTLEIINRKKER